MNVVEHCDYVPDESLRLANGLTVAEVAQVHIELQRKIDSSQLILVEGIGYCSRELLWSFQPGDPA